MKSLHLPGMNNVGDEVCSPALYFPELFSGIKKIKSEFEDDSEFVCYGGGAIASGVIADIEMRPNKKGILWGVGATKRSKSFLLPNHPEYPSQIILRGVRDWHVENPIQGYTWVPCASCMSPEFDNAPSPTKEVVFYGHKIVNEMPEMNNDEMDFSKVIKHLASGETVVTSSYHGVYWATLLGRKVIAIPFGSKFWGLKHQPRIVTDTNSLDFKGIEKFPDALEECRQANLQFKEKVLNLLK